MSIEKANAFKYSDHHFFDSRIEQIVESGVRNVVIFLDFSSIGKDGEPNGLSYAHSSNNGGTIVIWKIHQLQRDLFELLKTIDFLAEKRIRVELAGGDGVGVASESPAGRMILNTFAALLTDQNKEKLVLGNQAKRTVSGRFERRRGRKCSLSSMQIKMAQAELKKRETNISELCGRLNITRQTFYRYFAPNGSLRPHGKKVLSRLGKE